MSIKNGLPMSTDWELPRGWRSVRLGDVCLINPRRPEIARGDSEPTTFVPMPAVDEGGQGISRPEVKPFGQIKKGYTFFTEGDVLFAKITPCMQNGKHAVARNLLGGIGFGSTEFHVLRPTKAVLAEWVHAFLTKPEVLREAMSHFTGAVGQQRVPDSFLSDLTVPLPTLSDQKHIVAILDEQMATVEQARTAAEAQSKACIQFIEASLRESLSFPDAKSFLLKDCLTEVTQGVGSAWREYPLLGVSRAGLAPPKEAIGKSPDRYKMVDRGTIFYNPMRILLGSIALVDDDDDPGIASPDYVVCRTVEGVLHHRWFYFWLRSSFGEAFIKTLARGAVRERLLFKRLAAAEIVLASWETQLRAVEHMKDVMLLRRAVQEQIAAISRLPATLLAQAFSGQLSQRPTFRTRKATVAAPAFDLRGAVSSYIVNRLHDQPSFGNIQHQKLLFLAEAHVGLDLGGVYYRDKWGPHEGLDFYRLNGRGQWAEKRDVFHLRKRQGLRGYSYTVGPNMGEQVATAEMALGERKAALDALLDLFAPMTTDQAEMFATLFAVWNDFLIAGRTPTEAEIIQEFRENWHERKQKFMPDQLRDALAFMRAHQLVPRGIGTATRNKN